MVTGNQKLCRVLFITYLALLVYFLFFAESMGRTLSQEEYSYNLELFKEIRRFYTYRRKLGLVAVTLNLIGNIGAFVPFGFFLPVISRSGRKCFHTVLLSFLFSLVVETTQLIYKVGIFDVDDLLLNTLGGLLGYMFFKLAQVIRTRRKFHAKRKI